LNRDQIRISPLTEDLEISIIGKGNRPRTVYFSKRAIYWLNKYPSDKHFIHMAVLNLLKKEGRKNEK